MKDFIDSINWKKYFKIVLKFPIYLLLFGLVFGNPNKDWYWIFPFITFMFALTLLTLAYEHWLIKKHKTNIKKIKRVYSEVDPYGEEDWN